MRDCIDPLPGSRLLANDERVFLDALHVKIRDAPSRDPASPCVLQPIARSVSSVFFKQIF